MISVPKNQIPGMLCQVRSVLLVTSFHPVCLAEALMYNSIFQHFRLLSYQIFLFHQVYSNPNGVQHCVRFFYHMYGASIGMLNVYGIPQNTLPQLGTPAWTRSRDQGNQWLQAAVNLDITSNFQVKGIFCVSAMASAKLLSCLVT